MNSHAVQDHDPLPDIPSPRVLRDPSAALLGTPSLEAKPSSLTGLPASSRFDVFNLQGPLIITIDGPAGTGKSTVARLLARQLGLDFLDTGAMYRAAAAIGLDHHIARDDALALVALVDQGDVHFDWSTDPPTIVAFNRSYSTRIREPDVSAIVSPVSAIRELRQLMVRKQRQIAAAHRRLVSEGRDQGSVVFPDATVKFYLDADPAVRAQRRTEELRKKGYDANPATVLDDIIRRDQSDMSREDGPLTCPHDALRVDTSRLSVEQVVAELDRLVRVRARG
jgi:cytidylate kinase